MDKSNFIIRILDNLLPPDLHHLIGDLEEEFHFNNKHHGIASARFRFWSQLTRSIPWLLFQSIIWNIEMLKNYLKVTWRNAKKHSSFSLINIIGLAASMSVCLLIILFLVDQKSYDQFHQDKERIFRVITDYKSPSSNDGILYATSPSNLADILTQQFPQVELTTKIHGDFTKEFRYNDTVIPLNGLHADNNFFKLFDFELADGNPGTALINPGSIIITAEHAKALFGSENPMGKNITGLGDREYVITGVIENKYRTHFQFDVIISYSTLMANTSQEVLLSDWKNSFSSSYTYLKLKRGSAPETFQASLQNLIPQHFYDPEKKSVVESFSIQRLTSINLGPTIVNDLGLIIPGLIAWFLLGFAFIIVSIAIFNYVSLTIARALNRGKEVGIRKVLGADRSSIIKQFLFESVLIAFSSLIFGVLILRWLLPEFNSLFFISFTGNQVEGDLLLNPVTIISFIFFTSMVGVLAGIYPSLYLSKFNPAGILKGIFNVKGVSGQMIKKIITVGQFSFSIIFIITSMILVQQFRYMVNTDYGFNQEHMVHIDLQDIPYSQIKPQLERNPHAEKISATTTIPGLGSSWGVWLNSDSVDTRLRGHSFRVDENYIDVMGLDLIAGRNFNPEMTTDTASAIIISDKAAIQLGFSNPANAINAIVESNEEEYTVVGVIGNFISADPLNSGNPIALYYKPDETRYAIVKTYAGQTADFINQMEKSWLDTGSLFSFKYQIFDDQLKESPLLVIFLDFIKVLSVVGAFSIFISCLGLLGMAMYSAENRVKEIGIRKVLGASVQNIIILLSKEYLKLILIAIVIGIPISFLLNNLWMQNVSNKVGMDPMVFVVGGLGAILLAVFTIGTQAVKAASANSIDNLRSE